MRALQIEAQVCTLMTPSCTSLPLLQILLYLLIYLPQLSCTDIISWMNLNELSPSQSTKTEFLLIGTNQQRLKFSDPTNLSLSNVIIQVSSSARNLDFIFDSVSKSCHFHIRDIYGIHLWFWHVFIWSYQLYIQILSFPYPRHLLNSSLILTPSGEYWWRNCLVTIYFTDLRNIS